MLDSKWLAAHARSQPPRGKFQFRAHVPRTMEQPVMIADKPWESLMIGWHTLLYDGGRYRLWYECWDKTFQRDFDGRLCYAESDDLLHWQKPDIGLLAYRGSKQNNILFDATMGFGCGLHGHSVCIDPTAPLSERYRMIYAGYDGAQSGLMTAHSDDGIRWQIATKSAHRYRNDTQNIAFWDAGLGRYVGFFRSMEKDTRANRDKLVRCIARAETTNFNEWTQPVTVRTPDEADGPDTDFYNNGACRYESGGDVAYLMFPSTHHHDSDTCDVKLFTSRDSVSWQRFDRRTIIPNGAAANVSSRSGSEPEDDPRTHVRGCEGWDAGMVFACPALVPFRDEIALSYRGCVQKHSETKSGPVRYGGGVGLVLYPMDRFQGLWSEDLEATLCSIDLTEKPPRVCVNAIVDQAGEIRGALMKDGIVLPGCDFADCEPVTGNRLDGKLKWNGAAKLHWFGGQKVELRLKMKKATLFAIQVGD